MKTEEVEQLRQTARNRVLIGIAISVGLSFGLVFLTGILPLLIFGLAFGIIITAIISYKPKKAFIKAFKSAFVLKALEQTFSNLVYEPEKGLARHIIADTDMMHMGDRYSSNDYISGTYKNIRVVQADVHIEEEHETTDSDGHRSTEWRTLFLGRWMIFNFNKRFKANLQVRQTGFQNSKLSNWGTSARYRLIKLEDQAFNKSFRVYAQDEHEAFYILTPALMAKIKNLADHTSGKILLCFIDNKLHVGLANNKDSFEHGIFTKINEEKVITEISRDIKLITNFVDELDLDNDLFIKKETS